MDYHAGDTVMHWVHGLGTVIRRERREVLGTRASYYAVRIGEMTVWVPIDALVGKRLRKPTGKLRFKRTVALLAKPGALLPSDRHERKLVLAEYLKDGSVEGIVRIMRCMLAQRKQRALNDSDAALMHRIQTILLAEWAHVMGIPPVQAELQLQDLLRTSTG
jgi:RNA polymerase-interacting CarD/CdnL/TRCF family regulator